MPAPLPEELSTSAKEYFSGLGIALPMKWQPMGPQFSEAFTPPELSTPANPPTTLYHEPTLNSYHTKAARTLGRDYEQFIEKICAAISEAIATWMQNASIVNIELVGTIGTVLPMTEFDGTGVQLEPDAEVPTRIGPELKPLILNTAPQATIKEQEYSLAIATAISKNWDIWANGLTGILTYPPFGPPGPNIPTPLLTFTSVGEPNLEPRFLADEIFTNLGDPAALHAKELFLSIAQSVFINFQVFKTNSMVEGVIMTPPSPPPPEPPIEEEDEPEEEIEEDEAELQEGEDGKEGEEKGAEGEASESELMAAEPEPEPEPQPEPEPEEEPEPLPGGVVIPTLGNFV